MGNLTQSLADLHQPVRRELAAAQSIFDEELVSDLPFVNSLCERVRSYRGKMLRPGLLLLSAKATGEPASAHPVLAAVVEMVHMATLVHDDVLDQADERRRRPTVCATAGNSTAVLLGDYLISHAFHLCSGLEKQHASRLIGAATNTICEGELLQNRLRGNDRLNESTYTDIIQRKTGALTAVACELGAYYANASDSTVRAMRTYGLSVGIAFQIIDDILDITGEREVVGKTLGLDLASGRVTLPLIHCLTHARPEVASALRAAVVGAESCDREQLREWLAETDSVEYASNTASGYVSDALGQLEELPPSEAKTSLAALAEFIVHRHF